MFDMPDWLYEYLMKLPKEQVIEIMADALDLMQAYNGRTIAYCIVTSIEGATCTETNTGRYTYTLPKVK